MTEDSRPWTGTATGDAGPYSADEWAEIWRTLLAGHTTSPWQRSCVLAGDVGSGALVVSGAASPVGIAAGQALVHGTWYENDAATTLAIPTPGGATRIDRVVLEKDWATQTVRIARLAGVEGGGVPALTQTDGVLWQVSLAQASITTLGAITLTNERIFGPVGIFSIDPGSAASPGLRFVPDQDSGLERTLDNVIKMVTGGTVRQSWEASNMDFLPDGTTRLSYNAGTSTWEEMDPNSGAKQAQKTSLADGTGHVTAGVRYWHA